MLDLILLGSGGGLPMPQRFLSSMIINYRGRKILMDCGEGTQVSMRQFNTGFKSIDIICITHIHGDHIYGLPGLLSTIGNSDRSEPITIIGPDGIKGVMDNIVQLAPYLPYELSIIESSDQPLNFSISNNKLELKEIADEYNENIIIKTLELDHSIECIGYSFYLNRKPKFLLEKAINKAIPQAFWKRLQKGETVIYNDKNYHPEMVLGDQRPGIKISYITDTRPIESAINFIKGSNLFVCEGTYGDDEYLDKAENNKHMTFSEAAKLAYKAKVDELLLTHFSPSMDDPKIYLDNAKGVFHNTIIGYDGLTKTLKYK